MKYSIIISAFLCVAANNVVFTEELKSSKETKVLKRVFLRKVLSYEEPNTNSTKPVPWNKLLANVLVNRIKILSFTQSKQATDDNVETAPVKETFLTKCFSEVLTIYKTYIYDKFWYRTDDVNTIPTPASVAPPIGVDTHSDDPNNEVEIVEPAYHGKSICIEGLCSKTIEEEGSQDTEGAKNDCPEGEMRNADGICAKLDRFILAVPSHCPYGYKKDRLGWCRIVW